MRPHDTVWPIMGATFVMSFPGPDWQLVAGANRRAAAALAAGTSANPRAALREWIALADAIVQAGGRIVVAEPKPASSGSVYAADWGAVIRRADQPLFLLATSGTPHRAHDIEVARALFADAGVATQVVAAPWGGRGDLFQVLPSRYLFVAGTRTAPGAAADVQAELGPITRFVDAKLNAPFQFGDEVVAVATNKAGQTFLLVHEAGLANRTVPELRNAFKPAEVCPVDAADAEAGVCSALSVNGTVILAEGASTAPRGFLARNGFQLVELAMPQLFGIGGGGPHALVNELVGFVIGPGAPDYTRARERIVGLVDSYPERVVPAAAPSGSAP